MKICLVAFSSFVKFNFDLFILESNSLCFTSKDYIQCKNLKKNFFLTVTVTGKNRS